jgi:hypothetical protein
MDKRQGRMEIDDGGTREGERFCLIVQGQSSLRWSEFSSIAPFPHGLPPSCSKMLDGPCFHPLVATLVGRERTMDKEERDR